MSLIKISQPSSKQNDINYGDYSVGIDFGTTHSLACLYSEDKIQFAKHKDSYLLPSIIIITESGKIIIGEEEHLETEEKYIVIRSIKRLLLEASKAADFNKKITIGDIDILFNKENQMPFIRIFNTEYYLISLASKIFTKIIEIANKSFNKKISQAVITVPAHFYEKTRQWVKLAAELAHINVIRIINEPTAAMIDYDLENKDNSCFVVYDLGGGTFDVSVLRIKKGIIQVLSVDGDSFLGGNDFDELIIKHLEKTYKLTFLSLEEKKKIALKLKHELSKQNNASYKLENENITLELSLTKFQQITKKLIEKTINKMNEAILQSRIQKDEIEAILTVGGSTRMSIVKNSIKECFPEIKLLDHLDPDKIVAIGAAKKAATLDRRTVNNLLLDVVPLSLGIETLGGIFEKIIKKNSPIPIKITKEFTTSITNQFGITLNVFQGESEYIDNCLPLGNILLSNISSQEAGKPVIVVEFKINVDGLLNIVAFEKDTENKIKLDIQPLHGLDYKSIRKILEKSMNENTTT